mmetsp:Transcript_13883/g.37537  ORF Transcript_13883/g.37537 Transcript_13883/m.37537 type:complete len:271 (+) Transcript_13883:1352-2164(+)
MTIWRWWLPGRPSWPHASEIPRSRCPWEAPLRPYPWPCTTTIPRWRSLACWACVPPCTRSWMSMTVLRLPLLMQRAPYSSWPPRCEAQVLAPLQSPPPPQQLLLLIVEAGDPRAAACRVSSLSSLPRPLPPSFPPKRMLLRPLLPQQLLLRPTPPPCSPRPQLTPLPPSPPPPRLKPLQHPCRPASPLAQPPPPPPRPAAATAAQASSETVHIRPRAMLQQVESLCSKAAPGAPFTAGHFITKLKMHLRCCTEVVLLYHASTFCLCTPRG